MTIKDKIKTERLFFDGALGTILQKNGLMPGELPETWNLLHPEIITKLHEEYYRAGSDIISMNTFGVNRFKFDNISEIIKAAYNCADQARKNCSDLKKDLFIAYDMGPIGRMLKPLGDLAFEDAVSVFSECAHEAEICGADLIIIETMNDSYETKAALLAVKESTSLPVIVSTVYDENGKLMTGASPEVMISIIEGMGADALGINCSLGPREMLSVCSDIVKLSSIPVIVSPNAGLPKSVNGVTVYDITADEFSDVMVDIAKLGVNILGGCCGTTPEYIKKTVEKTKNISPVSMQDKNISIVSSYSKAVIFGDIPILIGERINPTGKKKVKEALRSNNLDFIINEGIMQEELGVHILDVNVGLPEINECEMMVKTVKELQTVTALPLQLDTVDPKSMEAAMRIYNGKPLVNSVNGTEESMCAIFPLVQKYGGVLIALTIDDKGIPEDAEGRYKIAEKIVKRAEEYGIKKKDIIVDPLAMTISSDTNGAVITLEAIKLIKNKLGVKCSLGVSNISFGLPSRDFINSTFFTMAMYAGLNAAIMNPCSHEMMKAYRSYLALTGKDDSFSNYIEFSNSIEVETKTRSLSSKQIEDNVSQLSHSIIKGLKDQAYDAAADLLKDTSPIDVIDNHIIPALDIVGRGFEDKTVFLPHLLMSAEAAKFAFNAVSEKIPSNEKVKKGKIILATVKGDIHDIGKNIVKALLENYGYDVIDLGRDTPPETVLNAVIENNVTLVGLSALMTTTVPSMEETIKLLREKTPGVTVIVGGAVMTPEYAEMIGADAYCKDAMESVRFAENYFCAE